MNLSRNSFCRALALTALTPLVFLVGLILLVLSAVNSTAGWFAARFRRRSANRPSRTRILVSGNGFLPCGTSPLSTPHALQAAHSRISVPYSRLLCSAPSRPLVSTAHCSCRMRTSVCNPPIAPHHTTTPTHLSTSFFTFLSLGSKSLQPRQNPRFHWLSSLFRSPVSPRKAALLSLALSSFPDI